LKKYSGNRKETPPVDIDTFFEYFESCHFSRENTNIEIYRYVRVYADLRMINMSSECEYD
jgi:hypothetical protein